MWAGVCWEQGAIGTVYAGPTVTGSVKTFIHANIATSHGGGEGGDGLTRKISRSSPGGPWDHRAQLSPAAQNHGIRGFKQPKVSSGRPWLRWVLGTEPGAAFTRCRDDQAGSHSAREL